MAKRKHKSIDSSKESVEEKVLKKYHKYKELKAGAGEESDTNPVIQEEEQSEPIISEGDSIKAEKIFKKVKKIKDKNLKLSKKLKKSAKSVSKEESSEQKGPNETESPNRSDLAIDYLNDWKYRPNEWKFKKSLQIWLMKNWWQISKLSEQNFNLFAEYVLGLHPDSSARKRLESEAKQVIDEQKEPEEVIERARRLVQCFV